MEYRVDSRTLKLFLAVAEQGSIGRAAESIPITQPALSKHMQRLEVQLGVTLFQRTSVGIELTPFGQALAVHARTVLAEVQRLQNRMADLREGRAGQVAIGAGTGILESYVAPAVTRLTHRYPDVRVTAAAGLAEDLLPALRDGELDILAGSRPAAGWPEEIVCTPWFKDEIGIVVRVGHPLQRRRGLTLESLRGSRWVLPPRQHTFTRGCTACFQSAGIAPPAATIVTTSATFIDHTVANSDALTFMPLDLIRAPSRQRMAQLRVPGSTWSREVCLFHRANTVQTPIIRALMHELMAMKPYRSIVSRATVESQA
ncbi:MAG: LysR family transcriptional regulator [Pigmentiphaga sp.]